MSRTVYQRIFCTFSIKKKKMDDLNYLKKKIHKVFFFSIARQFTDI